MSFKILYVEDNPQNMRLVRKMIDSHYEVLEALNGATGLSLAISAQPDLILMDINLPDIDGMEVTARLKDIPGTANIPVIALTANAMYGDRERFLAAGCDGYLAKPITRIELLNTLTHHLDRCRTS
jgi:two-component system cell cycle response regulator DivK